MYAQYKQGFYQFMFGSADQTLTHVAHVITATQSLEWVYA